MPSSATPGLGLVGEWSIDHFRVPHPGGVERFDADERRRGGMAVVKSLDFVPVVNGGWCTGVLAGFVGQMLLVQEVQRADIQFLCSLQSCADQHQENGAR
jgi:hypothetical protein